GDRERGFRVVAKNVDAERHLGRRFAHGERGRRHGGDGHRRDAAGEERCVPEVLHDDRVEARPRQRTGTGPTRPPPLPPPQPTPAPASARAQAAAERAPPPPPRLARGLPGRAGRWITPTRRSITSLEVEAGRCPRSRSTATAAVARLDVGLTEGAGDAEHEEA